MRLPRSILIALGGNAIVRPGEPATISAQKATVRETMAELAELLARAARAGSAPRVVLTHGNGPQVGDILLRSELARTEMGAIPIDVAVADTQGFLGSILAWTLKDELARRGVARDVAAVVTHVVVDPHDPAFARPEKPVGAFYSTLPEGRRPDWIVREFPPHGWRRVVPSPPPLEVLEQATIGALHERGTIVIAAGGGGVPVARAATGRLRGVEAVVDKDLTSALLGAALGIETLAILTGVEKVQIDYGKPHARSLDRVTPAELRAHSAAGQFPRGSMGPKIDAALAFLERGGQHVLVTAEDRLILGLEGKTGTHVVRE